MQAEGDSDCTAVASFTVEKSGKISDLHLDKTSGSIALDQAAMQAITQASPFAALPDPNRELSVQYKFSKQMFEIPLFGVPSVHIGLLNRATIEGHGFRSPLL
ncbi:MAG TPA: TonB family protein [Planktothrix sp.]|jgi:TonB family protein